MNNEADEVKEIPQSGELWHHDRYGLVKIIRKWNDKESVCEILAQKNRRALLINCFMEKRPLAGV